MTQDGRDDRLHKIEVRLVESATLFAEQQAQMRKQLDRLTHLLGQLGRLLQGAHPPGVLTRLDRLERDREQLRASDERRRRMLWSLALLVIALLLQSAWELVTRQPLEHVVPAETVRIDSRPNLPSVKETNSFMSIVSLGQLQTFLPGGSDLSTTDLERLSLIHDRVERCIKRFVRYEIEQATYIEFYPAVLPGPASSILALGQLPVRSITSVHEDRAARGGQQAGDFDDETLLVAGQDYYVDMQTSGLCQNGHLLRIGARWPARPRSVRVEYVAGWTKEELSGEASVDVSDIQLATLLAVKECFEQQTHESGLQATRLGDYSVEFASRTASISLPLQSRRLLSPYVKREVL